jgi:hypothetical protein
VVSPDVDIGIEREYDRTGMVGDATMRSRSA